MFIDRVTLSLYAGNGGNGAIAWRREKFIPKGGPAGGDGGNGGSIILEATSEILSLEDLRNRRIIKAKNGQPGGGRNCSGKNAQDLILLVPLGTLVKDAETGEILFDLTEMGQQCKICEGGKGGKGNTHFKTPTNRAPNICTEGTKGTSVEVELELKLIADIGFVGMPNAGKSTLIQRLAKVPVKIAPYPFTTLKPNLGLVLFDDFSRLLIADIPGIIEEAHQDRGLGLEFLRHVERSSTLIFLIELSPWEENRNPFEEFLMLRNELQQHNPALLEKPFLVALNKIDREDVQPLIQAFRAQYPLPLETLFEISAMNGDGCPALLEAARALAQRDGKKF